MSKSAIVLTKPAQLAIPPELVAQAHGFAQAATADNTRRAYRRQWAAFEEWCSARGMASLPAHGETLALYVTHLAEKGLKVASIEQASAAITAAHRAAGHPSPREHGGARLVLRGIRRTKGAPQRQATPILAAAMRAMVSALPPGLSGARDRALLLLGLYGAFRRSELVALEVSDVGMTTEGLEVTIRRSKTDQEGQGRKVAIPFAGTPAVCPVRAVKAWLGFSAVKSGPLFREVTRHELLGEKALTGQSVARIVKRAARAAGMDVATLSGHSLRAGFATQAARKGKSERSIMAQTGHKSVVIARRYIRNAEMWTDNAASGLLD